MRLKSEVSATERLYKVFIYVVLGLLAVLILVPVLWVMVGHGGLCEGDCRTLRKPLGTAYPYPLAEFCRCMVQGQHGWLYVPLRDDHRTGTGYSAALGWNKYMYEILPGFVANWVTIIILNRVFIQRNEAILKEFDEVIAEVKSGK